MSLADITWFPEPYVVCERALPDGRVAQVVPLTFGRFQVNVGRRGAVCHDEHW